LKENETIIRLTHDGQPVHGQIKIGGSKSISNRVLIINALAGASMPIYNLSNSDDTQTLKKLLSTDKNELDAHHAGTTFRFLTAYLCLQEGSHVLTGSERMLQRPIGPLVDALRQLGADIKYMRQEGYPPLKISGPIKVKQNKVEIRSDVSSQFLSALCMIGPMIPGGLTIELTGEQVSKSYLDMTLAIMTEFGAKVTYKEGEICITEFPYKPIEYTVESDWSSASYYFTIAAIAEEASIELTHFNEISLQADSAMRNLARKLGVVSRVVDNVLHIHSTMMTSEMLCHDFVLHPDIVQTVSVATAACGIPISYNGLKTLFIKETDRVKALQSELGKVGIIIEKDTGQFEYKQHGDIVINEPTFETYQDHRMAMCLAPLAMLAPIKIINPEVVSKSYPDFWTDLSKLGFRIEEIV